MTRGRYSTVLLSAAWPKPRAEAVAAQGLAVLHSSLTEPDSATVAAFRVTFTLASKSTTRTRILQWV